MESFAALNLFLSIMVLKVYSLGSDCRVPQWLRCLCQRRKVKEAGSETDTSDWHEVAKKCDSYIFVTSLLFVICATCIFTMIL